MNWRSLWNSWVKVMLFDRPKHLPISQNPFVRFSNTYCHSAEKDTIHNANQTEEIPSDHRRFSPSMWSTYSITSSNLKRWKSDVSSWTICGSLTSWRFVPLAKHRTWTVQLERRRWSVRKIRNFWSRTDDDLTESDKLNRTPKTCARFKLFLNGIIWCRVVSVDQFDVPIYR